MEKLLNFWPRCHPNRLFLLILACTGMRTMEAIRLKKECFRDGGIVWALGKNQKGFRSCLLPPHVWDEVQEYFTNGNITTKGIWPFKSPGSVARAIQKVRPFLGGNFELMCPARGSLKQKYIINLKSFRHTYQCVLWWEHYHDSILGGSGELAAAFVSNHMHHAGHSFGLTAKHYIASIEYLKEDLAKLKRLCIFDIVKLANQTKLGEFIY